MKFYDYQLDAINRLKRGSILCGGVGSGKSLTSLGYYFKLFGGSFDNDNYIPMKSPKDLYIITTPKKRDSLEWEGELSNFLLSTDPKINKYNNNVIIDSWNNIKKYKDVKSAFFIFDEQRVVGYGAWTKSFIEIAKWNHWILLSATPGDTWQDYIGVFIANGFFKNKTDFIRRHAIYSRNSKFPKIERYFDEHILEGYRESILVDMDFTRKTNAQHINLNFDYDINLYKSVIRTRWNPIKNEPITNPSEYCQLLRRIVNSDESRLNKVVEIALEKKRVIIFYNFNYELDILRNTAKKCYEKSGIAYDIAEWNGHKHEPVPNSQYWIYLVQYTSGSEAWNCITTNTMIFYSQNYSYKIMEQSSGRIDRLNTPYKNLYYYHFGSKSSIDIAIHRALVKKKQFNEKKWCKF